MDVFLCNGAGKLSGGIVCLVPETTKIAYARVEPCQSLQSRYALLSGQPDSLGSRTPRTWRRR